MVVEYLFFPKVSNNFQNCELASCTMTSPERNSTWGQCNDTKLLNDKDISKPNL